MTKEEAIKILKAIRVYECYPKSASEETKEAIDMAIDALSAEAVHKPDYSYEADMVRRLKEALSAEARPTGEWIFNTSTSNGKSWNVCSECGESMFHPANFCPNCGARMKGADDE